MRLLEKVPNVSPDLATILDQIAFPNPPTLEHALPSCKITLRHARLALQPAEAYQ